MGATGTKGKVEMRLTALQETQERDRNKLQEGQRRLEEGEKEIRQMIEAIVGAQAPTGSKVAKTRRHDQSATEIREIAKKRENGNEPRNGREPQGEKGNNRVEETRTREQKRVTFAAEPGMQRSREEVREQETSSSEGARPLWTVVVRRPVRKLQTVEQRKLRSSLLRPLAVLIKIPEGRSYEETVKEIRKESGINPSDMGANVTRMRRARNGLLLSEIANTEGARKTVGNLSEQIVSKLQGKVKQTVPLGVMERRGENYRPNLFIKDHPISIKKSTKYLGLTMDKWRTYTPHVERVSGKAIKTVAALARIMQILKSKEGPRTQVDTGSEKM